jgi:hypothetical protein
LRQRFAFQLLLQKNYSGSFCPRDATNVTPFTGPDSFRSNRSATGWNDIDVVKTGASPAAFKNVFAENFGALVFVSAAATLFASTRDSRVTLSRFTATMALASVSLAALVFLPDHSVRNTVGRRLRGRFLRLKVAKVFFALT